MFDIISNLFFPSAVGFINGFLHAFCHLIGIKNHQVHQHFLQHGRQFVSVIFHCAKNLLYLHPEWQPVKLPADPSPSRNKIYTNQYINFSQVAIAVSISTRSSVSTSL